MLNDPSPHRTSACPVHFLWDGRGKGRALVRGAFLALLVAGMCFTAGRWLRMDALEMVATAVAALAGAAWLVGQGITVVVAREMKRELLEKRAAR